LTLLFGDIAADMVAGVNADMAASMAGKLFAESIAGLLTDMTQLSLTANHFLKNSRNYAPAKIQCC